MTSSSVRPSRNLSVGARLTSPAAPLDGNAKDAHLFSIVFRAHIALAVGGSWLLWLVGLALTSFGCGRARRT